ncbi:hypothetical protein LAZ67_1004908 [Cordylochernes scorpioides]|uniref:Reverse transcriptase domain-containing protein n=1 Tax=Cordylochernes scorpioides TaxID=51811 RepID=A0ABY6JXR7_9ARAC|nr:hypothetical protein LAZ67_1004908 [Cordylochernes scorpioides]
MKSLRFVWSGGSPSWNIAQVTDAVEEATAMGSPLAVVGVDLESAFDSVDRGFLESLMISLRLPPAFIGWIKILYAGADATIRAGGYHTTAFLLHNGLRQGCAVSAALFSIATGPLLRRLESTLGVGNVPAYADDIVLLIHRDEQFERVAAVLEDFKRASGIGVNLGKSAGLWVLGMDIAPRSSVAHREQHLLALLESACRKAGNSLVSSTIQHHLHGYLPRAATTYKLQARLARFVWGPDNTARLPAAVMARLVAIGGLGLLDVGTQLQLACLKGVQVALRGGRNGFNWLVASEAWIRPPPDGTRLQPRRHQLRRLWEEASKILGLNHRLVPTSQLLDLPIVGSCRFLRPPDLLAPARWVRARDLGDPHIDRPTRSALADAVALAAFCQRVVAENVQNESFRETTLAGAVVLLGTATPFLGLTTRSARRALDRPRLAATPISRVDWASLRRCAFSGHEADAALKLALHALPHPAHPASAGSSCPACGSVDCSLGHRYWSCQSNRPLVREAFNIIGRPPDLQAWIFGSGLEDEALTILASAKLRIYRHFAQVGLGGVEDPLIAWSRTLARRGCDTHVNLAAARDVTAPTTAASLSENPANPASLNWADSEMAEVGANDDFIVVKGKKRRRGSTSTEHAARQPNKPGDQRSSQQRKRPTGPRAVPPQEIKATRANIAAARARQTSTAHENYVFVELCPDIPDYSYLRAMRRLFGGPGGITQFNKMKSHYIVGLETKDLALRLVEGGLEIEGTTLRVFPYRKRAERIIIANLPGFVEDRTIVNALGP